MAVKLYIENKRLVIDTLGASGIKEYSTNDVIIVKYSTPSTAHSIIVNGSKILTVNIGDLQTKDGTLYTQETFDTFRFNSTGGDIIYSTDVDSLGASTKNYLFRNQNYLNSGSALNVKLAGQFLFYDISTSSTLSARSANDDFVIDSTKMHFKDNFIYDMKVKLKLEPEVSNNHLELALAKDTFNIYDESTITTTKLEDARYEVEFNGFHYTADKGNVKLFISKCTTGGSALNVHTIKIVIKEIGENLA